MLNKIVNINKNFINSYKNILKSYYHHLKTSHLKYYLNQKSKQIDNGKIIISNIINKPFGINIIGKASAICGHGQGVRNLETSLKISGINCKIIDISTLNSSNLEDNLQYSINLFFVFSGELINYLNQLDITKINKFYNIHLAAWELENYPNEWSNLLNIFDEVWAVSSFVQNSIAKISSVPVINMGNPVCDIKLQSHTKEIQLNYGINETDFVFLFCFDLSSGIERKNPECLLNAFNKAFINNNEVKLIIKSSNKNASKGQTDLYKKLQQQYGNKKIIFLEENLSYENYLKLIAESDAYISLHRSEGFGLTIAEAIALGVPVIATGYSGNTDFCKPFNSLLVDYELIPVKPNEYFNFQNQYWAEPNLTDAINKMQLIYKDKNLRENLIKKANEFVKSNLSSLAYSNKIKERVEKLHFK